jgi:hypothetical protein
LCWHLSRASDLPLHPVDLWAYDHQARLPVGDTLDDQLARGPEAAGDGFESVSQLRLGLLLDDIQWRDLGTVPAIVEGPQLMPGFAGQLPPGWGVWLVPDPARTRLALEERLAKAEALAPALRSAPRLAPGSELSRQRRYENRAADRQGRLWMRDAGLTAAPSYPFGCECGTSGRRATWTAAPDDYAARTASERRLIAHSP